MLRCDFGYLWIIDHVGSPKNRTFFVNCWIYRDCNMSQRILQLIDKLVGGLEHDWDLIWLNGT